MTPGLSFLIKREIVMKQYLISLVLLFIIVSCGEKESANLKAFNPEAFAYDLGDQWEVNASTRVKGFAQKENQKKYSAKLSVEIDLVTPQNDTIYSLISRTDEVIKEEKIMDVPLEAQFELDSSYSTGTYTIIFHIKDALSGKETVSSAEFQLEEE
jgi:hypothetical protein